MLVLVAYDVNTTTDEGRKRLGKVARKCVGVGQRVQNSVFECSLDAGQLKRFEAELLKLVDLEQDSLRFYLLGNNYEAKIRHFGVKPGYLPDDFMCI